MTEITRMASVEPVVYGVVKIVWLDGYEAIVDLRPVLSGGDIFEFLRRSPDAFRRVRLGDHGHTIEWTDEVGDTIDFGSDALRTRAIRQAEILKRAS